MADPLPPVQLRSAMEVWLNEEKEEIILRWADPPYMLNDPNAKPQGPQRIISLTLKGDLDICPVEESRPPNDILPLVVEETEEDPEA